MVEYLGNCSDIVDWDQFINQLEKIEPMIGYQYDENRAESQDITVKEIASAWATAGYPMTNTSSNSPLAWEAWYSGVHFDQTIQDKICDLLGITPIDVSMVTRLIPGRFAPWHWDIRNSETIERFSSYGKPIIRVHIHMTRPQPGHVFVIGNHCFYNEEQGSMYKWVNWQDYHAGANCGLGAKYQFSIIGISK
jgi:hypothetical protein